MGVLKQVAPLLGKRVSQANGRGRPYCGRVAAMGGWHCLLWAAPKERGRQGYFNGALDRWQCTHL